MTKITIEIQTDGGMPLRLLLTIMGIELAVLGALVTVAVGIGLL